MPGSVRIADVASAAGVSIATVSASLNEVVSARISADTRARVREVADRLGYVPNRLAQGLRGQRSGTIGFVGDTVATTPYAVGMVLGALEAARAADRVVVLMNTAGHRDLEARELATLLQHQVDGVLYATMFHRFACARVAALVAVLVMFLALQRQFIRSIASAGAKG